MRAQTKLTLRLDKELIEAAKRYAEISGNSLSQLVADYFPAWIKAVGTGDTKGKSAERRSKKC
ncbi:MAG: DUF6364 family protein [Gammaproteobacteria bacterium]